MAETRAAERVFSEDILIFYFSLPNTGRGKLIVFPWVHKTVHFGFITDAFFIRDRRESKPFRSQTPTKEHLILSDS